MEDYDQLAHSLGANIASYRKDLKLTQKQLAVGICSQSMISSIEQGNYVPNAILLAEICQRLGISVDSSLLSSYYQINENQAFNEQVEKLCNNHQYQELIKYLDSSGMAEKLYRNEDLQVYYYYYGCGSYQLHHDGEAAVRYLRMALAYTYSPRKKQLTGLEALILAGINFIESETGRTDSMANFELAMTAMQRPDANLNVVYYQYALALLHQKQIKKSIKVLEAGVKWATDNNINFMLGDFCFLLAQEYQATGQLEKAQEANNQYHVISNLFHQNINRAI